MKRTRAAAKKPPLPTFELVDAHCHLDHMADAEALAQAAATLGLGICCATVTPTEYEAACERFAGCTNVCVGLGLHPWWLADGRCGGEDVDRLVLALGCAPLVAEVGLDFAGERGASRAEQLMAFEELVRACAQHPLAGRVLSIHAVRAAGDALDLLERYDLPRHAACIFHWFSGTSEELARARRLGCLFSVNERMLATKRGREYARIIPEERLLLETDAPVAFDTEYPLDTWMRELEGTLEHLAQIRSCDASELRRAITATSNRVFACCFAAPPGAAPERAKRRR